MKRTQESCSSVLWGLIRLGIPFLFAIWAAIWATNSFINSKSGFVALGSLAMLVCFWFGFIGFFRLFHELPRGTKAFGWVIAALVLSVVTSFFLIRDFFDPDSVTSIRRAVAVVCEGENVSAAGIYQPGADSHIVLMSDMGASGKFSSEWRPASLGDVELVVCPDVPTYTRIETCRYSMGGTIERYRENQPVRLMVAQTGEVFASTTLTDDAPTCPSSKLKDRGSSLHGSVTDRIIEDWVLSILSTGAHTPTPRVTSTPTRTQTPTSTPLPVEVTFDTINNYPVGHLIVFVGRLTLGNSITCSFNECSLTLENPAQPSQTITIFVRTGSDPNQMKPLPDPYIKSDIQVQLDDGTFAVVGYRIRVTGRVCSSTNNELCISDITKIELFQLK